MSAVHLNNSKKFWRIVAGYFTPWIEENPTMAPVQEHFKPNLNHCPVPLLLNADDMVLLSWTHIGLKFTATNKVCQFTFPSLFSLIANQGRQSPFQFLEEPQLHWMFTLARCNAFRSRILKAKFHNSTQFDTTCSYSKGSTESLIHIIFHCPFYLIVRHMLLNLLIVNYPLCKEILRKLLASFAITRQLTKFFW